MKLVAGVLLVGLLALAGCKGDPPAPPPVVPLAAAPAAIEPAALRALPGQLWFLDEVGPTLRRIGDGAIRDVPALHEGAALYLSTAQLADGRIVAISSFGDGRVDGEQLVLFDGEKVSPIGPRATAVRTPTINRARTWIVAAYTTDGVSNLRVHDLATAQSRLLTRDPQGNFTPAAVGDDHVGYVSSRDGDSEVYLQHVTTDATTRLTAFHREDYDPSADPSGTTIAFVSDREQGVARIFLVAPDGTHLRRLTTREDPAVDEGAVLWQRDDLLAYAITERGRTSLVLRVGTAERIATPAGASDHEPVFSPDGNHLAVIRERPGQPTELVVVATRRAGPDLVVARGKVRLPRWF